MKRDRKAKHPEGTLNLRGLDLREAILDRHEQNLSPETLNVAARMIVERDRLELMCRVGLEHLARSMNAERATLRLGTPQDEALELTASFRVSPDTPSPAEVVTNRGTWVQAMWGLRGPEVVAHREVDPGGVETRLAMLIVPVRRGTSEAIGLLCLHRLGRESDWSEHARTYLEGFAKEVLNPLLGQVRPGDGDEPTPGLSPAELEAVRLVARGYSHKEVAHALNKSVRTVGHQIRSARAKVGAGNQAELIRLCRSLL
ncbi:MAG: LuxR C-terminal-related transcriptional regulator [Myxococcota bacterium]